MDGIGRGLENTAMYRAPRFTADTGAVGQLCRLFRDLNALPDKAGKSLICNGRRNDLVKNAINSLLPGENGKVGKRVGKEHDII